MLADNLEALFRNVPPPLSLALAMTEKHENASLRKSCATVAVASSRRCTFWRSGLLFSGTVISEGFAGSRTHQRGRRLSG